MACPLLTRATKPHFLRRRGHRRCRGVRRITRPERRLRARCGEWTPRSEAPIGGVRVARKVRMNAVGWRRDSPRGADKGPDPWSLITSDSPSPSERYGHTAVLDESGGGLCLCPPWGSSNVYTCRTHHDFRWMRQQGCLLRRPTHLQHRGQPLAPARGERFREPVYKLLTSDRLGSRGPPLPLGCGVSRSALHLGRRL